ncbi:MAG: hypothetical protein FJ102_27120, partial [Deltaproteobacteria bacterium]|nr:hypothetical protein [Deltaproteobacteria bacterium]
MLLLALSALAEETRPFAVTPGGWVRPAFAWQQDDSGLGAAADGFSVEARMGLEAVAEPIGVRARVEMEFAPDPSLKDAFVNYTPVPYFSLNAGQFKVPFSIHRLSSDTKRQFPTDPRLADAMGIKREIGASAEGRLFLAQKPRLSLTSGVFNGEGSNVAENGNDRFMFAQRVLLAPLGMRERPFEGTGRDPYVGVGGGWIYNRTGDDEAAEETNILQVELQAAVGVFSIQGEYAGREVVHASAELADYHATAAYGQLGCFIPVKWASEHLELVARGGWTEPNDALESAPEELATVDIDAGLNLYVPRTPKW